MQLHPWNVSFTWADHKGPFRALNDEQVAQFDRDGFIVIEDFLDAATLQRTVEEIDQFDARSEAFLRRQQNERLSIAEAGAIVFTPHLVGRSEWLRRLAAYPLIGAICHDLIGPEVRLYWDQAVYKKPEKPRRFPWHQDNGYTFLEPQAYLTIWLALSDATLDNGCPQIARGLHRLGTLRHHYVDPLGWECLTEPADVTAAELPAGGAVIFSSLTPHLTGPNLSGTTRKAYILQYAPDGARTQQGDAQKGPPTGSTLCDEPTRQFPILVGGVAAGT